MATRTIVQIEDDLNGGSADETLIFGLDGKAYEIDLNEANASALRQVLAPYVLAGRRGVRVKAQTASPSPANSDAAAIRAWAVEQGYEVSSRGRVSADLRAAYEAS